MLELTQWAHWPLVGTVAHWPLARHWPFLSILSILSILSPYLRRKSQADDLRHLRHHVTGLGQER